MKKVKLSDIKKINKKSKYLINYIKYNLFINIFFILFAMIISDSEGEFFMSLGFIFFFKNIIISGFLEKQTKKFNLYYFMKKLIINFGISFYFIIIGKLMINYQLLPELNRDPMIFFATIACTFFLYIYINMEISIIFQNSLNSKALKKIKKALSLKNESNKIKKIEFLISKYKNLQKKIYKPYRLKKTNDVFYSGDLFLFNLNDYAISKPDKEKLNSLEKKIIRKYKKL